MQPTNAHISNESSPTPEFGPFKGKCCSKPGDKIKGTFFFAGAGIDGKYITLVCKALHTAGVSNVQYVDRDKWSGGTPLDAVVGVFAGRDFDPQFPMLLRTSQSIGPQFNLVGYSYGSLLAAQVAAKYANKGTIIDHLVLIGSPISQNFLKKLHSLANIKTIIIINLEEHGDPITAGMDGIDIAIGAFAMAKQMPNGSGHFYYAKLGKEGDIRRSKLATSLYNAGLR